MILNGSIVTAGPPVPATLKDRVYLRTTCEFLPEEINAVGTALIAFDRALAQDKNVPNMLYTNALFIDSDEFSMSITDPESRGNVLSLVVYPLNRWRADHMTNLQMIVATLEELCHHFWSIRDELLVKYKVLDVIRQVYPRLELNDIYNVRVLANDLGLSVPAGLPTHKSDPE